MISLSYFTDNSTTSSWDSGAFHWGHPIAGWCEAENPMDGATEYHHFTSRIIPRIIPLVSNWDDIPLISIPDATHGAGIFTYITGPFLGFLCR